MAFKIAIFTLNQWALDFVGNTKRILRSIDLARDSNALYRAGPELELCGYSLEDAFFEKDTVYHCWSCLIEIIDYSSKMNIVVDVGMPVHHSALYNCRVIIYKGKIVCIRAKTSLAREGNYREFRYFKEWASGVVVPYKLPTFVSKKLDQDFVPFGSDFILQLEIPNYPDQIKIGWEICQELWDLKNVSSDLYNNFGCHLILNGSGSYWELRKLNTVTDMIKGISLRAGACYAFSNLIGCDGQRYVFYGRSCIYDRGRLVDMTPTSSNIFEEIQMISHTIHPRDIDEYRAQMGIYPDVCIKESQVWNFTNPTLDVSQVNSSYKIYLLKMSPVERTSQTVVSKHSTDISIRFELEINQYVSLWLWDYLRRSQMKGFMIPLSGGLDSTTVALLVFNMCNQLHQMLNKQEVQAYFEHVHQMDPQALSIRLSSPMEICKHLLRCRYISTKYSGQDTQRRAETLSKAIGADFCIVPMHDIYTKCRDIESAEKNGTDSVSLLEQNIQARLRMTLTYYMSGGCRIVLATGNVDEAIMGYLTKYDCSSADINPIGGLCKEDLKSYLRYCCSDDLFGSNRELVTVLNEIIGAPPSAELTGSEQRDEDEIGVTYDEISVLGRVRRGIYGCSGPRGAFETVWRNRDQAPFSNRIRCLRNLAGKSNSEIASELGDLIKRFYLRYSRNRHKLTVLTPALHAETYSPDDNRFDHRQFLYPPLTLQFREIDMMIEQIAKGGNIS